MHVVVGGHSRQIGKTSVVAGLIQALPQANWTAMKITQFGHGVCATSGTECDCCLAPEHAYAIAAEPGANESDSGRFLGSGARRSYWVRTAQGQLAQALPAIRELLATSENAIIESNSILQFLEPDLYLVVLDFAQLDFKASCLKYLDRADATVVIERDAAQPRWQGVGRDLWSAKPSYSVRPPQYVTPELAGFVSARLTARQA